MVIQVTNNLETCTCANCGIVFAFPEKIMDEFRGSHKSFFCPMGHSQYFPGETQTERLQKELKRKEQELANRVQSELQAKAALVAAEKKLKRVQNGVCPCCNRTFKDLAQHMATKHPEHKQIKRKPGRPRKHS